jgi:hypothetical protein
MSCPSNYSRFYHPNKFGEEYGSLSSPFCSLFPNCFLGTLFSDTLSLHTHTKQQAKIIYFKIYLYVLNRKLEGKRF